MAFAMATLGRSKSGRYVARKGVPKDVRAEYKRLYKEGGWEAKFSAEASHVLADAKARFNDRLAEVESRIATIRAQQKGEGITLSQKRAHALAGDWYKWFVSRHEDSPVTLDHWDKRFRVLVDQLEAYAPEEIRGQPW